MSEHSRDNDPEADQFDMLTQGLFVPEGNLQEVDQRYLSQPPTAERWSR